MSSHGAGEFVACHYLQFVELVAQNMIEANAP